MLAYVDRLIVGALKANSLKHSCPVLLSLHRSTYSDRNGCNIVGLSEDDFTEKFVRGSGPGGQSINKTSNCVKLKHVTGVMVSCQETRYVKLV